MGQSAALVAPGHDALSTPSRQDKRAAGVHTVDLYSEEQFEHIDVIELMAKELGVKV